MTLAGRIADRLRRAKIAILVAAKPRWVRVSDVDLRVPEWADKPTRRFVHGGKYERAESVLLGESLKPDDRVLELGTGLGLMAVLCSRKCGSDAVMTVEANARLAPFIEETFRRNGVSPQFRLGLVGRDDSVRSFHAFDAFLASSVEGGRFQGTAASLRQIPLDELVAEHRPTYLIMDIEGAECGLAGMPVAAGVRTVLIEFHKHLVGEEKVAAVKDWLVAEGFVLVRSIKAVGLYERRPQGSTA